MVLGNDQAHRKRLLTKEEDSKLIKYIKNHGEGNWNSVRKVVGLDRDGKSCRERRANHLKPGIKKGACCKEDEEIIIQLHANHGNKWSHMAKITRRSANKKKNFWYGRSRRERQKVLILDDNKMENKVKLELNSAEASHFPSMVSTTYPLYNPSRSTHNGLSNTQENQPFPVPTFMSQHLEHFESNMEYPFLNNCLSDSVPVFSMHPFGRINYGINSHSYAEHPLVFTPRVHIGSDNCFFKWMVHDRQ